MSELWNKEDLKPVKISKSKGYVGKPYININKTNSFYITKNDSDEIYKVELDINDDTDEVKYFTVVSSTEKHYKLRVVRNTLSIVTDFGLIVGKLSKGIIYFNLPKKDVIISIV